MVRLRAAGDGGPSTLPDVEKERGPHPYWLVALSLLYRSPAVQFRAGAERVRPTALHTGKPQPAFFTLPADRHDVQTRIRLRVPFSVTMRAGWRLGSQRRRVLLLAWLTLFPVRGPFPQTAH